MNRGRRPARQADRISPFFGEVLKTRRQDLGLSLEDVARGVGCSAITVRYHEQGACFLPRPWLFWGFAKALDLEPQEMHEAAYYSLSPAARLEYLTYLRTRERTEDQLLRRRRAA